MRNLICIVALALLTGACAATDSTEASSANDPRWLTSVVDGSPTDDGWILPPGSWATQAFDSAMVFETDRELALVAADDEIVYLRTPGADDLIMVARFTGMWNGSADVPVPVETDAMTDAWRANPANQVGDLGVLDADGAEVPWWDITITERPEFTFACALGTTCAFNAFAGNSKIFSLQGERMRSYARNDLQVGLGVHAAATPEAIDRAVSAADAIATSLRAAPDDLGEPPEPTMLGQHTGFRLPAGPFVVPMDGAALMLDLPEETADYDWFTTVGSFQLSADGAGLVVSHPVLVDLDAPLGCPGSEFEPPMSPTGFQPLGPVGEAELEAYLKSQMEVVESGTTELLGTEVSWWEVGEPMPDRLADCGSTQKHTLIGFYEGGIASSVDDPPKRLRMYRITDRLIVMAFGTEDDLLSPFTPVLDHLSVL